VPVDSAVPIEVARRLQCRCGRRWHRPGRIRLQVQRRI